MFHPMFHNNPLIDRQLARRESVKAGNGTNLILRDNYPLWPAKHLLFFTNYPLWRNYINS